MPQLFLFHGWRWLNLCFLRSPWQDWWNNLSFINHLSFYQCYCITSSTVFIGYLTFIDIVTNGLSGTSLLSIWLPMAYPVCKQVLCVQNACSSWKCETMCTIFMISSFSLTVSIVPGRMEAVLLNKTKTHKHFLMKNCMVTRLFKKNVRN